VIVDHQGRQDPQEVLEIKARRDHPEQLDKMVQPDRLVLQVPQDKMDQQEVQEQREQLVKMDQQEVQEQREQLV
jgi:hypothetical protein